MSGKQQIPPSSRAAHAAARTAELEAIAAELSHVYEPLPDSAAATGLRPEEWVALERRDVDRRAGLLNVLRTVSDGEVVELAKTSRSRRQVPLSRRALEALDRLPPRLETPLLFSSPRGRLLDVHNFSRREWAPAVEVSGVAKPARVYDLRSTFASNGLAAGVTVFELARIMGTSVLMIERHYGALLDGAQAGSQGGWTRSRPSLKRNVRDRIQVSLIRARCRPRRAERRRANSSQRRVCGRRLARTDRQPSLRSSPRRSPASARLGRSGTQRRSRRSGGRQQRATRVHVATRTST
jgi:Phage integrase family